MRLYVEHRIMHRESWIRSLEILFGSYSVASCIDYLVIVLRTVTRSLGWGNVTATISAFPPFGFPRNNVPILSLFFLHIHAFAPCKHQVKDSPHMYGMLVACLRHAYSMLATRLSHARWTLCTLKSQSSFFCIFCTQIHSCQNIPSCTLAAHD